MRIRIGECYQHLLCQLQCLDSLITTYGRKIIQEFIKAIAGFQIVNQVFDGNTRALEHGCARKNFVIACDNIAYRYCFLFFRFYNYYLLNRNSVAQPYQDFNIFS